MEKNFLELILETRKKLGLSRRELARKVGCTDTAIKYWETGKRVPSITMAHKILEALGIKISLGKEINNEASQK